MLSGIMGDVHLRYRSWLLLVQKLCISIAGRFKVLSFLDQARKACDPGGYSRFSLYHGGYYALAPGAIESDG